MIRKREKQGRINSRYGGFIDDVDKFDPLFFNISPKDAGLMDPQERLFLQTAWHAVEDAGYEVKALSKHINGEDLRTGVYVGVMYQEYKHFGVEQTLKGAPMALSTTASSVANRVSYCFDLHGPSITLDTMCSSSLTAIHLACQALENDDTDMAIAGGVNVSIHPDKYLMLSRDMFLSGRGKCESFGSEGEGFIPSEGVGAVLLKPLHKAELDGDRIYGVIKASALNHGGKSNGYTAPDPNAQAVVIKKKLLKKRE